MPVKDKQDRILPLFEYVALDTSDKFGLRVQRDDKLRGLGVLGRGQIFSCFFEPHLKEATQLYEALISAETFDEFLELCHQARDFVNEGLYTYAVSVAVLHRPDCRGVSLPPLQEVFPDKFIPGETLNKAYYESTKIPEDEDVIHDMQETGNILDPEYKLAYYREDIGVNVHHWHWHLVYPATWRPEITGIVKDRKGELFYYMHQQMCARYDCERLSNGLPRMIPFHNFEEPMEGYSSHLVASINFMPYAFRTAGSTLQDTPECAVQDLERWRDRIIGAIQLGHVVDETGTEFPLDEETGINVLGDLIESSYDSVNREYYGSIHNWGHVLFAAIKDPDSRFQLNPGVMSDTATSLRDPIFYRWHRFIDDMLLEYKKSLPHYTKHQLGFTGVEIKSTCIRAKKTDEITTFFTKDELNISRAYNMARTGAIKIRYQHIDHEPFTYKINVFNKGSKTKEATVRIFLAPVKDELGNDIDLHTLRRLAIEMDKFKVALQPGDNVIERKSSESSVTIKDPKSLDELARGELADEHEKEFCSCGWPDHLLVPKGDEQGMKFHLFVMLTDRRMDAVGDHGKTGVCSDAVSYCGAKDQLYPDKRAMGFPFDREVDEDHLEKWLLPNMSNTIVTILHH
uniref:Hemocyanin subunit b n=1 Tax=Mastigoproctus giganteus TaxID=58767 RepID=G8YZR9_MASGI|nr:hemocyanin subunit b [Mastigoproctus giganteus]